MTRDIIAASPQNKFSQAFQFFAERSINHMPIVEDGKIVGLISNKDMMKQVYTHVFVGKKTDMNALDQELKLADIMTKNIVTADEDTPIMEVKELFGRAPFNCLPVTNKEGKLVGIVSPKDLMKMKIIHIEGSDYPGY